MFSIAYRMLGSVAEAEDVVQDALLRMHQAETDGTSFASPDAFATTVATRLAIDTLRSARVRRELYVGPWLPEPLARSEDTDPARRIQTDETVSTAFLVLLETLSPTERAVFILREVFGYGYAEVAEIVERNEANCRQILARAKRALDQGRPRYEADRTHQEELSRRFLAAANDGDMAALTSLLADDVVFVGDGGGKAPAIRQPIHGAPQVARFMAGLARQAARINVRVDLEEANGVPALYARSADGAVLSVLTIEFSGGHIHALHNQLNPDKLRHLGPVGDLAALLARD